MAFWHLLQRIAPSPDRRWVVAFVMIALAVAAAFYVRWSGPAPPLDLLALDAEGRFVDTLHVPVEWGDTAVTTPDAVVRVPLILGVRNRGDRPVRPERLSLSLPVRYRLAATGRRDLAPRLEQGGPLVTYTLYPGFGPVEPGRLPTLLPAHDTLWLEVIIPSYYCVAVADSIPEFVPATPPPLAPLSAIRIFYSFEGGDLGDRRTGTVSVRIDTSLLDIELPDQPRAFPMRSDPALAQPALEALQLVGSRRSRCGEPEAPMELLSTVWETPSGGRFIALDYGGKVRKHLYDLDGDGVIERESWDPSGTGRFTATRRAALPIPGFLLPEAPAGRYDLAAYDGLSPDSLARLDPFRRAMPGPGPLPADSLTRAGAARPPGIRDELPEPVIQRPAGPLGRPVPTAPPDTGGVR